MEGSNGKGTWVALVAVVVLAAPLTPVGAEEAAVEATMSVVPDAAGDAEGAEAKADEVSMRFAPPSGTTYLEKKVVVRDHDDGDGSQWTERTEIVRRFEVKGGLMGYTVRVEPVSADVWRNGRPVRTPMVSYLGEAEIEYVVGDKGLLTAVSGIADVARDVKGRFQGTDAKSAELVLDADTLEKREILEWTARVGDFHDKTVELGDEWNQEAELDGPMGIIPYEALLRFEERVACAERSDCVQVHYTYTSDISAINEELEALAKDAFGPGGEKPFAIRSTIVKGEGRRVFDPDTLLPYGETLERHFEIPLDTSEGAARTATIDETIEFSYDYSPNAKASEAASESGDTEDSESEDAAS